MIAYGIVFGVLSFLAFCVYLERDEPKAFGQFCFRSLVILPFVGRSYGWW